MGVRPRIRAEHVSGAECGKRSGAGRKSGGAERSGERTLQKKVGVERSAERQVAERGAG